MGCTVYILFVIRVMLRNLLVALITLIELTCTHVDATYATISRQYTFHNHVALDIACHGFGQNWCA